MKIRKSATKAIKRGLYISLLGILPNSIFAAGAVDIKNYADKAAAKTALTMPTITGKQILDTSTAAEGDYLSSAYGLTSVDAKGLGVITKYLISVDAENGDLTYTPYYYGVDIDNKTYTTTEDSEDDSDIKYYWNSNGTISTDSGTNYNEDTSILAFIITYDTNATIKGTKVDSTYTGDFIGNYASEGGAIYTYATTINSINSNFIGNSASYGGAIYVWRTTINSIIGDFIGNYASYGGAIYNKANDGRSSTVSSITGDFIGNTASYGGAIYNTASNSSSATITSITGDFIGNTSSSSGGAIYNYASGADFESGTGYATIGSIIGDFIDNSGSYGGAIYISAKTGVVGSGSATIGSISGNFIGNTASSKGGAVYVSGGSSVTFSAAVGEDYYYLGNSADDYSDSNGGFLYINSGKVYFDVNGSITIGTGETGYDSIAGTTSATITKTGEGTLTVNSSMASYKGKLNVNGGTFEYTNDELLGVANLVIGDASAVDADDSTISTSDGFDAKFIASADGLSSTTSITVDSDGTLNLTGGTLTALVEGSGTIEVDENYTLTTSANNLATDYIDNDGTIDLTGGTLSDTTLSGTGDINIGYDTSVAVGDTTLTDESTLNNYGKITAEDGSTTGIVLEDKSVLNNYGTISADITVGTDAELNVIITGDITTGTDAILSGSLIGSDIEIGVSYDTTLDFYNIVGASTVIFSDTTADAEIVLDVDASYASYVYIENNNTVSVEDEITITTDDVTIYIKVDEYDKVTFEVKEGTFTIAEGSTQTTDILSTSDDASLKVEGNLYAGTLGDSSKVTISAGGTATITTIESTASVEVAGGTLKTESDLVLLNDNAEDGAAGLNATSGVVETTGTITISEGTTSITEGKTLELIADLSLAASTSATLGSEGSTLILTNSEVSLGSGSSLALIYTEISGSTAVFRGTVGGTESVELGTIFVSDSNVTTAVEVANANVAGAYISFAEGATGDLTAINVTTSDVRITGDVYATASSGDSLTAIKISTGDDAAATITLAEGIIISSIGSDEAIAIQNSHNDGVADTSLTIILEGSVSIVGKIIANSDIYLNSSSTEAELNLSGVDSAITTDGDTATITGVALNLSEGTQLDTSDGAGSYGELIVENGSLTGDDATVDVGDATFIDSDLTLSNGSDMTVNGDFTLSGDVNIDLSQDSNLTVTGEVINDADISLSADALLSDLVNDVYATVIAGLGEEQGVDATNGTFIYNNDTGEIIIESLNHFQTKYAGESANTLALATAFDNIENNGVDTEAKRDFKTTMYDEDLGNYIMATNSYIAEVNTMLLNNMNYANVNRARSILEKSAGAEIQDEDGTISFENEDGDIEIVDAESVSLIKYSNVAQLQSINLLGSKDSSNGVAGYDYWSVGATANFDEILSDNALVGVSIGGTYNKVEGDAGDNADSTTFLLNAYAVYANEGLELFGNVGYAHFWNEGYKAGVASADWDSDAFNALVGVSYDLATTIDGLTITPLAMLNLVFLDAEKATYSNGVVVDDQSYFSAKLMLGFEVEYAITAQFNTIARVMYAHEMGDTSYDNTYGVSNGLISGVNYIGSETGADSAVLGLGLSYDFSDTCTMYFDYNAYVYSSLITHSLNLSLGIKF